MTELRKAWDRAWLAAERRSWVKGLLGQPDGTLTLTDRPGFVYVRVSVEGAQTITMAKHLGRVPLRANLPVRMRIENGVYVVYGVDDFYYDAATSSDTANAFGVPAHTHAIGSGLEYEVEAQRLAPGLVRPAGGWLVAVGLVRYYAAGAWQTYSGESLSLFASRPTTSGKHRWALISLNTATNLAEIDLGSDENYATALAVADLDSISIGDNIPLGAVQIRADDTGLTALAKYYDARGWLNIGGGASTLADLTDTNIVTPSNGQMLYYNSVGGWYNDDAPLIPQNFEDLADVSFTTLANGDTLIYDVGSNDWVNIPPTLEGLTDVAITTPADGDLLVYDDGSELWVNAAPADVVAGGELGDLSDVVTSTPATGDILRYDGADWVNAYIGRTIITDWSFRDAQALSTSSFAWKGNRFTPDKDVDIFALCYFGTIVANGVYQAAIITGTATPGNVATATKSASYTAGSSPATLLGGHMWLEFSSPVRLTAGTQYGLMVGRTDSTGTYQLPVNFNGGTNAANAVPMVGLSHGTGWRVADAALTVGTAISEAGGNSMACGFRFRYPSSSY